MKKLITLILALVLMIPAASSLALAEDAPGQSFDGDYVLRRGDLNGDEKINARDVVRLMQIIISGKAVKIRSDAAKSADAERADAGDSSENERADMNADGKVNARDVVELMKAVVAAKVGSPKSPSDGLIDRIIADFADYMNLNAEQKEAFAPEVRFYGEFRFSASAVLFEAPEFTYTTETIDERIAGCDFRYNCGNKILVWDNGRFLSLKKAYENGILTDGNIFDIAARHMYNKYLTLNSRVPAIPIRPDLEPGGERENVKYIGVLNDPANSVCDSVKAKRFPILRGYDEYMAFVDSLPKTTIMESAEGQRWYSSLPDASNLGAEELEDLKDDVFVVFSKAYPSGSIRYDVKGATVNEFGNLVVNVTEYDPLGGTCDMNYVTTVLVIDGEYAKDIGFASIITSVTYELYPDAE